jgi:hypothetical protein
MKKARADKQLDNTNFESKIVLREHFLEKYHKGTRPKVLDCCAGQQKIWKRLRSRYDVDYLGCDTKVIPGTLHVDSAIYLNSGNGATFDVIDIDTYGCPFRHLEAAAPHVKKPTTFFVTYGHNGMTTPQAAELKALGITFKAPQSLVRMASTELLGELLASLLLPNVIEYAAETEGGKGRATTFVRYIGLRVVPSAA